MDLLVDAFDPLEVLVLLRQLLSELDEVAAAHGEAVVRARRLGRRLHHGRAERELGPLLAGDVIGRARDVIGARGVAFHELHAAEEGEVAAQVLAPADVLGLDK